MDILEVWYEDYYQVVLGLVDTSFYALGEVYKDKKV